MKKTLLLLFLIAFVSCSEKSDPQPLKANVTPATITGTWLVESIDYSECAAPGSDYSIPSKCPEHCRKYIFAEDGSFLYQYSEDGVTFDNESGVYTVSGTDLSVATWAVYTFAINDSVMTWTTSEDGCKLTMILVRQ